MLYIFEISNINYGIVDGIIASNTPFVGPCLLAAQVRTVAMTTSKRLCQVKNQVNDPEYLCSHVSVGPLYKYANISKNQRSRLVCLYLNKDQKHLQKAKTQYQKFGTNVWDKPQLLFGQEVQDKLIYPTSPSYSDPFFSSIDLLALPRVKITERLRHAD